MFEFEAYIVVSHVLVLSILRLDAFISDARETEIPLVEENEVRTKKCVK